MADILADANTLEEARQLQKQLVGLLAKGCFDTHKWCANHPDIVQDVPEELRGNSFAVTDDSSKPTVKTLGVTWNSVEDWFSVVVPDYDDKGTVTRRNLLSQLAKIFDPLGFFGPVITTAKLILREAGDLQIDWDDPVPPDVSIKWCNFRNDMTVLNEAQLPRWISWKGSPTLQLHGFSDASDLAYGACLYVRAAFPDDSIQMRLICSKSRILPKKGRRTRRLQLLTLSRSAACQTDCEAPGVNRAGVRVYVALERFENCIRVDQEISLRDTNLCRQSCNRNQETHPEQQLELYSHGRESSRSDFPRSPAKKADRCYDVVDRTTLLPLLGRRGNGDR